MLTYLVLVLFTFYIQVVLKLKKNSGAKVLINLGGGGRNDTVFPPLVQTCGCLDMINKCTSFSLKSTCDLEVNDKMIVAEKKIGIW